MQVDHIDANTIRVKISKEELAKRGVRVLDMLSDRSKIQNFFYSILSEVDTDHSFSQNAPVSFQVMPNNGGLDLLITKVRTNNMGQLKRIFGKQQTVNASAAQQPGQKGFADLQPQTSDRAQLFKQQAYAFSDLSNLIELADNLRVTDLASSLYYRNQTYYLELSFLNNAYQELKPRDAWTIANEFGLRVPAQKMKIVKETGRCLFRQSALENIRSYFIKKNR